MADAPGQREAYRRAGVDVAAGDALVRAIAPLAARTRRPGVMSGLGGFGGLFDLAEAGYRDPVLVAAADGVGTKLQTAVECGSLQGIGIDLVAMCVNDLVCQGAEPLFFLDYYATGKLEPEAAREVIEGIAEGCRQAGAALLGGETAEMPGHYPPGSFDLAGFAVGAAERARILPAPASPGDLVFGFASDGLHANGFSLVRKLVREQGLEWDSPAPFDPSVRLGAAVLTPTRIYTTAALKIARRGLVRGLAHITGGGITGNALRAVPEGPALDISLSAWPLPPLFRWIAACGNLTAAEMLATFNCGIGMIAVCPPMHRAAVAGIAAECGETLIELGRVTEQPGGGVRYLGRWPNE